MRPKAKAKAHAKAKAKPCPARHAKSLSAVELEERYGAVLAAPPYAEMKSAYLLHRALVLAHPAVAFGYPACRIWWTKHRVMAGGIRLSSSREVEEKYGAVLREETMTDASVFMFQKALEARSPPLLVSEEVAKGWLREHGGYVRVDSAGHLELRCGDGIREDREALVMGGRELMAWLRAKKQVQASLRVCEYWKQQDWSSSNSLRSIEAVEEALGEQLRLQQYAQDFLEEAASDLLAVRLGEGQPSHVVRGMLLRQWYTKYHQDSGPLRPSNAAELERMLGPDLRMLYSGLPRCKLVKALGRRRRPVFVAPQVCRVWRTQYGARRFASAQELERAMGREPVSYTHLRAHET